MASTLSAPPSTTLIHNDPKVGILRDFLTSQECTDLISLASLNLVPSPVVKGVSESQVSSSRTSRTYYVPRDKILWLLERVRNLTDHSISQMENVQVTRYQKGEFYRAHHDAFDADDIPHEQQGGQRVTTVLIYLNDVKAGGATYFPKIDVKIEPEKGKVLVFRPSVDGVVGDDRTLHEAQAAIDEKWVLQIFIRAFSHIKS